MVVNVALADGDACDATWAGGGAPGLNAGACAAEEDDVPGVTDACKLEPFPGL